MPQSLEVPVAMPPEVASILSRCPGYRFFTGIKELVDAAAGEDDGGWTEVAYDVPGKGRVVEAEVCRVRNGIAANYPEPYMRRRDPDCMVIADSLPTNKKKYADRFGKDFIDLRTRTFDWLATQELALFAFTAGQSDKGVDALVVAPANAGFFALGLGLLQGILGPDELTPNFQPRAVIYVAPPLPTHRLPRETSRRPQSPRRDARAVQLQPLSGTKRQKRHLRRAHQPR